MHIGQQDRDIVMAFIALESGVESLRVMSTNINDQYGLKFDDELYVLKALSSAMPLSENQRASSSTTRIIL
jgi:hypothetical protein